LRYRKLPPCQAACPAHVNIQAYVALIQRGKFKEAVEVIRRDMPFPAICGRVCFAPCEKACVRSGIDQAVAIRSLKRLAADIERELGPVRGEPLPKKHDKKIAVIGAGPAGLSAAYFLVRMGYPVTVFERAEKPGGKLWQIPERLLERFVIASEVAFIQDLGVEIVCNAEIGRGYLEVLRKEYDVVFIACGKISEESPISPELLDGDQRNPVIVVDPETMATKITRIFAGGDAVRKRLSGVVQAVADGKRAAASIHRYLSGLDLEAGRETIVEVTWVKDRKAIVKKPQRYFVRKGERKPRIDFDDAPALLEEIKRKARLEALRCLSCGPCEECLAGTGLCDLERPIVDENLCIGCGICMLACPYGAISRNERGVAQIDFELCKGCGICVTRCPVSAIKVEHSASHQAVEQVVAGFRRRGE